MGCPAHVQWSADALKAPTDREAVLRALQVIAGAAAAAAAGTAGIAARGSLQIRLALSFRCKVANVQGARVQVSTVLRHVGAQNSVGTLLAGS